MTAQDVEIKDRLSAARESLGRVQARVESMRDELKRLEALEATGMVPKAEVQQLRYALEAALEKDVLEKVK